MKSLEHIFLPRGANLHTDLFGYVFSVLFHTSIICSSFRIPPPPLPAVFFFSQGIFRAGKKSGHKFAVHSAAFMEMSDLL